MAEILSDGAPAPFAMLWLEPAGPLLAALQQGRLQPGDMAVLLVVINHVDWRTGRSWIEAEELAAAMGNIDISMVQKALGRLCREVLLARGSDKRERWRTYWCVNPVAVAATGGRVRRQRQWEQFQRALEHPAQAA